MDPLLNASTPISRLNRDILWRIFSINSDTLWPPVPSLLWHRPFEPHLSPLTITRHSSQVCSVWREVILESPSIWGNCLDLDRLWQDHDDWRREVLRRTGNALLAVRDRRSAIAFLPSGLLEFMVDIISNHWERIKLLEISIYEEMVADTRVWNAFRRPARNLRVFAVRDVRLREDNPGPVFNLSQNDQLFANDAPLLIHFFVHRREVDASLFTPSSLIPIPSILRKGQLRHLTLMQPLVFPVLDLLATLSQMPLLEELSIEVVNLTFENPQDHHLSTPSLQTISLPRLKSIRIFSQCLEIYPELLGRLIAHPSQVNIRTMVDSTPAHPSGMLGQYANIRDMLPRDMANSFQGHHSVWSSGIKYLELGLSVSRILLVAYQETNRKHSVYRVEMLFEAHPIPSVIGESFIDMLIHLSLPTTLVRFLFMCSAFFKRSWNIPSLSPLFIALGSITELYTDTKGLSYIIEQSESEGITFFDSLRIVILDEIGAQNAPSSHLKRFLATRQHTAPVEMLDLTQIRGPFGDLRYLDEIVGLKVVWDGKVQSGKVGRMEYVCGSGNPDCLLSTGRS